MKIPVALASAGADRVMKGQEMPHRKTPAQLAFSFLSFALLKTWRAFNQTPWEIDRLFGLGVAGLGVVFWLWPTEVVRYGFGFLEPIIHTACWIVFFIGLFQIVVGISEWWRGRQVAAFACFFVYAAISCNNASPSGQWMYGVCALAEAMIFLKRY